jgi:hypothetical protein
VSASLRHAGIVLAASRLNGFDPIRPLRRRWERPLAWWCIIALCGGFWFGVLRLLGAL